MNEWFRRQSAKLLGDYVEVTVKAGCKRCGSSDTRVYRQHKAQYQKRG